MTNRQNEKIYLGQRRRAIACLWLLVGLLVGLLLGATPANAQEVKFVAEGNATIRAQVTHTMHDALFESQPQLAFAFEVDGLFGSSPLVVGIDEIQLGVRGFDSGDRNRDSNMLDVLNAYTHPVIRFAPSAASLAPVTDKTEDTRDVHLFRFILAGELTFAGVKQAGTRLTGTLRVEADRWHATAETIIELSAHQIERPSLALLPISNKLPIAIEIGGKLVAPAPTDKK